MTATMGVGIAAETFIAGLAVIALAEAVTLSLKRRTRRLARWNRRQAARALRGPEDAAWAHRAAHAHTAKRLSR